MFIGSKYPKKNYFNFEKNFTDQQLFGKLHWNSLASRGTNLAAAHAYWNCYNLARYPRWFASMKLFFLVFTFVCLKVL